MSTDGKLIVDAIVGLSSMYNMQDVVFAQKCVKRGMNVNQGVQAMANRIMELECEVKVLQSMIPNSKNQE